MIEMLRTLIGTYREQAAYLVVGCMTTLVNYLVYGVLTNATSLHYIASNVAAWVAAVTFSYFANGKWVYCSTSSRSVKEAFSFAFSRLFSLGLETLLLFLLVDFLLVDEMVAKLLVAVLVVIVNYFTGLLVFKRKKGA